MLVTVTVITRDAPVSAALSAHGRADIRAALAVTGCGCDTHRAEAPRAAEAQVRSGTVPGVGGVALEAGGEGRSEAAGGQRIDRLIGPVGRGTQLEDCALPKHIRTLPELCVCLSND